MSLNQVAEMERLSLATAQLEDWGKSIENGDTRHLKNHFLELINHLIEDIQAKIFTPASQAILEETVEGLHRVDYPERNLLKKTFWLVIIPLYAHLKRRILTDDTHTLKEIDLVKTLLDELIHITDHKKQLSALSCLISHLKENQP